MANENTIEFKYPKILSRLLADDIQHEEFLMLYKQLMLESQAFVRFGRVLARCAKRESRLTGFFSAPHGMDNGDVTLMLREDQLFLKNDLHHKVYIFPISDATRSIAEEAIFLGNFEEFYNTVEDEISEMAVSVSFKVIDLMMEETKVNDSSLTTVH